MSIISSAFIEVLSTKFDILDVIDYTDVDKNFDKLAERLLQTKKKSFLPKDRYIIAHVDTDYYLPYCPYGLSTFNLVRTFLHNDIPMNTVLLLTNHIGIEREFRLLIPEEMHEHNFPTIIDNCITLPTNLRLGLNQQECNVDESLIVKHGVSMFGQPRIHRNMLYNQLMKENLLDTYSVSYKGDESVS